MRQMLVLVPSYFTDIPTEVSKILTSTQRNYSQIQKEALSIIFGLKKFYQFVYGRKFILLTDHRPLLAMFGPNKATSSLADNRLARWALITAVSAAYI